MNAGRADLTAEEWEALLVPTTILRRLTELGLALERAGQPRVSDRGKALILRHKDVKRR